MDHDYIAEQHLVDRYLMNRLPEDEARRFEEHYVSCRQCLDQLELAEKFQRGLRRAACEDAARVAAAARLGLLARLARAPRAMLATLALLVALLPAALLLREARRLGRELERAEAAVAELERRRAEAPAAEDPRLAAERRRLEEELARAESERRDLAARLEGLLRPQINTAIFALSPERGAPLSGPPSHVVRLGDEPEWIVLALELAAPEDDVYRVVLLRGEDEVWRRDGLAPDPRGDLVLSLHSSQLTAGDYLLRVEPPRRGAPPVAHFAFRVVTGG
ncbi:MAG: hypothetical protein D6696_05070 [Acidobacteria bacterium]|nr:MAG: hypothetical protein D6696_05070 [Acidobacteriota bacterium]